MKTCEWCGESFDYQEAEDQFEAEYCTKSYANFRKCLCGKCAIEAFEDMVDGVYYEICEKCGKTFDYMEDDGEFYNHLDWADGVRLDSFSDILCCDCALRELDKD